MRKKNRHPVSLPTFEQVEAERSRLDENKKKRHKVWKVVSVLLVVAAIAVLVATQLVPVLQVSGSSMEPTLYEGDVVVLTKSKTYKRGDVCGLYWQNKLLLKRVIALPGEVVNMDKEGNVYIDGELQDEPYLKKKSLGRCDIQFPYQVPDGQLFVMGDNRATSVDSRCAEVGCINEDETVGRVLYRAWPLKRLKWMR